MSKAKVLGQKKTGMSEAESGPIARGKGWVREAGECQMYNVACKVSKTPLIVSSLGQAQAGPVQRLHQLGSVQ